MRVLQNKILPPLLGERAGVMGLSQRSKHLRAPHPPSPRGRGNNQQVHHHCLYGLCWPGPDRLGGRP